MPTRSAIAARVWRFELGGHQVLKNWLSYRESAVLGRTLLREAVRTVRSMVQRLASVLVLAPTLDENCLADREAPHGWSGAADAQMNGGAG